MRPGQSIIGLRGRRATYLLLDSGIRHRLRRNEKFFHDILPSKYQKPNPLSRLIIQLQMTGIQPFPMLCLSVFGGVNLRSQK